jgi:hypothetical protein
VRPGARPAAWAAHGAAATRAAACNGFPLHIRLHLHTAGPRDHGLDVRSFTIGPAFTWPPTAAEDELLAGPPAAAVAAAAPAPAPAPGSDSAASTPEARHGGGAALPQGPAVVDLELTGGLDAALACYHRAAEGADVCVVDGCLVAPGAQPAGDAADAAPAHGACPREAIGDSAAEAVRALGLPLLLVIDASAPRCAAGAAAVVHGASAEPGGSGLEVAGLVLNRVAGEDQLKELRRGLEEAGVSAPIVAALPQLAAARAPGPLLGSPDCAAAPWCGGAAAACALAAAAKAQVSCNLELLLEIGRRAAVPAAPAPLPPPARAFRAAVGVAYDAAFHEYFQQ